MIPPCYDPIFGVFLTNVYLMVGKLCDIHKLSKSVFGRQKITIDEVRDKNQLKNMQIDYDCISFILRFYLLIIIIIKMNL